jgi:GNAT superfamily N-acetyltransferase
MNWHRDPFTISCDPADIDRDLVHRFLASSYWAQGIPRERVDKAIDGSLCFSVLEGTRQVGFARVISDRATIAYLGDVFILPEYQGQGLGTWLTECVVSHPELQGLRRWILVTRDAHEVYRRVGFTELKRPEGFMELHNPSVYSGA